MGKTEKEMFALKYRFSLGTQYSLRGTSHWGPSDIVPQVPGFYTYPKSDSESCPKNPSDSVEIRPDYNYHVPIYNPKMLLRSKKKK